MFPLQGEVWDVVFGEEFGDRPGIIITRNELNRGTLVLVVPCTSSRVDERAGLQNHVFLRAGQAGLEKDCVAQVHLIQPVARQWLTVRRGKLDDEKLSEVLQALVWSVDLYPPA